MAPGPGHYPTVVSLDRNGVYFLSKFQSSGCRRFGRESRASVSTRGSQLNTPGPGSYRAPSEFGYYQAKNSLVEEHQRVAQRRQSMTAATKTRPQDSPKSVRGSPRSQGMLSTFSSTRLSHSSSQPSLNNGKNQSDILDPK